MELSRLLFARLLLIWILIVSHGCSLKVASSRLQPRVAFRSLDQDEYSLDSGWHFGRRHQRLGELVQELICILLFA